MQKLFNHVLTLFTAISSIMAILSFYGYSAKGYSILWFIIFAIIFVILIAVSIIITKKHDDKFDDSQIRKSTKKLSSLVANIRQRKDNNISAKSLSYTYKWSITEGLIISIVIEEIRKHGNNFIIGLINTDDLIHVERIINNIPYPAQIVPNDNNRYNLYSFNLLDSDISEIELKISQPNAKSISNLYFCPKNYVRDVDCICIDVPKKKYKIYESGFRKYKQPIEVTYEDKIQILEKCNRAKLNSVFVFEKYNE